MECLFCVNIDYDLIEIFGKTGKALEAADIISKHFWFQLNPDEGSSKFVCKVCWSKVYDFNVFYCDVEKHHLQNLYKPVTVDDFLAEATKTSVKAELADKFSVEFVKLEVPEVAVKHEIDSDNETAVFLGKVEAKIETSVPILRKRVKSTKNNKVKWEKKNEEISTNTAELAVRIERLKKNRGDVHLIPDFYKMECELCKTVFDKWKDVNQHYRKHHNKRGYLVCRLCDRKVRKLVFTMDHIEFHRNPEAFKCDICSNSFENRKALTSHKLVHYQTQDKAYQCHQCDKQYFWKHSLYNHIIRIHVSDENKLFPCSQCDAKFASQYLTNHHVRLVHEKAYEKFCEICARTFPNQTSYEQHKINQHSENQPKVQCPNCKKWLKSCSLRRHEVVCPERSNKSIHVCNICGKESPNERALHKHKTDVHAPRKLHPCNFCDKMFKRAISLKEHMASHTGEVLYSCSICSKTFNSNANKYAHFKKNHREEWVAAQLEKSKGM